MSRKFSGKSTMTTSSRGWVFVLSLAACVSAIAAESGESYPNKPVRLIVGNAPGGGSDFVARLLAQHISLGQTIVIDNRAGAGGIVAAELTANAPPDGYTMVVVASSHTSNVNLYRKLPYDTAKDFAPVTQLTANFFFLAVNPSSPAKTVSEFVALAKAKKGALTYASAGNGQGAHLGMELLKTLGGFDAVHVPYNGIGPAAVALVSGQVEVALLTPPTTVPLMKAGKLKVLALTGPKRLASLADVPTVAESGFPGYEVNNWIGVLAPARTPNEIINKFYAALAGGLKVNEVVERLAAVYTEPVGSTPQEFGAFMQAEIAKWGKVIKQSGARAD